VTDREQNISDALAHIGISIAPHPRSRAGWGWSLQSDKIIRDWEGPYASPSAAAEAALSWLLEHARKGLLCEHVHPAASADRPAAADDDTLAPWLRAFPAGIGQAD